jgi:hypothetical protein
MKVIRVIDSPRVQAGLSEHGAPMVVRVAQAQPTWLKDFDADAEDGFGRFEFTTDPDDAKRFEDAAAASEEWRRQSTVRPLRDDGKPNRPLTAYTVIIENARRKHHE